MILNTHSGAYPTLHPTLKLTYAVGSPLSLTHNCVCCRALLQMGRTVFHHLKFTPTKYAAKTARLLLQAGCDPRIADLAGASPQDWMLPARSVESAVVCLMLDVAVRHWDEWAGSRVDTLLAAVDAVANNWFRTQPGVQIFGGGGGGASGGGGGTSGGSAGCSYPADDASGDGGVSSLQMGPLSLSPERQRRPPPATTAPASPPPPSTPLRDRGSRGLDGMASPLLTSSRAAASAAAIRAPLADSPLRPAHMTTGLSSSPQMPRMWAWYALLLIDETPPGAPRGVVERREPLIQFRRIAVLESSTVDLTAQRKSIALSQDPLSGYVVGAAVGPVLAETPALAEAACRRIMAVWRAEARKAVEARVCLANCSRLSTEKEARDWAKSQPPPPPTADVPSSTSSSGEGAEVPLPADAAIVAPAVPVPTACPQVCGAGGCEYSALRALDGVLLQLRGGGAGGAADDAVQQLARLPVDSIRVLLWKWLTLPRCVAPSDRLMPMAESKKSADGAGEEEGGAPAAAVPARLQPLRIAPTGSPARGGWRGLRAGVRAGAPPCSPAR